MRVVGLGVRCIRGLGRPRSEVEEGVVVWGCLTVRIFSLTITKSSCVFFSLSLITNSEFESVCLLNAVIKQINTKI